MQTMGYHNLTMFEEYLKQEEKSQATLEKYLRDIRRFLAFLDGRTVNKAVSYTHLSGWGLNAA